jgi:hypothetical protein
MYSWGGDSIRGQVASFGTNRADGPSSQALGSIIRPDAQYTLWRRRGQGTWFNAAERV